jgi:periplasmic protein CpxP/Spy
MNRTQWKVAMGAALLGLCSFAAYAQSAPPATPQTEDGPGAPHGNWRRGGGPERELERLTHMLTLTADQQTGVKALLEQQSTQMKALRTKTQSETGGAQTPETRQAGMTQMDQIRDETDTKISALLDDNQKKTFADMIARRKAAMARHESREGAPSPPAGAGPGGI